MCMNIFKVKKIYNIYIKNKLNCKSKNWVT